MAWPLSVVVGWSSSILTHILRPVLLLSVLPLVVSGEPPVGVVLVVTIIVSTVVIVLIVVIMATIIIVPAIVITATIVIPRETVVIASIIVVAPILVIAIVVVFRIVVVVPGSVSGPWPIGVPVGWYASCLGLSGLPLDLSDGRGISVE